MQVSTMDWNKMGLKSRRMCSGVLSLALTVAIGCNTNSGEKLSGDHPERGGGEPTENVWPDSFGLGRLAVQTEIDSLSTAIPPSGIGLPAGEGLALRGRLVYAQKCAACHGPSGKEGPQDVLVATDPVFSESTRVRKAIGNYWPYSTTVFDYIRRAMPLNAPGSLSKQ